VLTGHVDSVRQGPGPFSRLGELAPGDIVAVVDEAGVERSFTVLSREEWAKSEVPMDRLFDRGGSARLVLITCGGDFDAASGHYEDNVAVTAVPTPGSPG
jgi:sortase (surface protein transpeptidase)